jgi:hypothetical protein
MASEIDKPQWFVLGDQLLWPLIGIAVRSAHEHDHASEDSRAVTELAFCHHAGCMQASMYANEQGKHSAAICLVRQSVEALTVGEIGLQRTEVAEPLLADWRSGKPHGALRRGLQTLVWPRYGNGLWDEPWADFYANLARAVQPYAHYSYELQGWQYSVLASDFDNREMIPSRAS